MRRPRLLIAAAAVLFMADRLLKGVAVDGARADAGFASFELFRNTGTVFSLPVPQPVILAASVVLLGLFAFALVRSFGRKGSAWPALLMIVLGAVSNLADRLLHGAVIDYLVFFGISAVNLADAMIVAGVAMLLLDGKAPAEGPRLS